MGSQAYLSKDCIINHYPTLEKRGIIRGNWPLLSIAMNRILLVDDETDINLVFKIVLEDRGFKVDTFEDPIAALENYRPDLCSYMIC